MSSALDIEIDPEEEVIDTKLGIEKTCHAHDPCPKLWLKYEECAKRVEAKGEGECSGQYKDYWGCIDHCVQEKFFKTLK